MIILIEIIERKNENIDVDTMSPLTWAYIGDAVYELYIRNYLIGEEKIYESWSVISRRRN